MWKRTKRNQYGEITNVSSSDQPWYVATEKPVFDSINGVKYTVEYLRKDNAEAAEKADLRESSVEPWELRDTYETDSLGLFIQRILLSMFHEDIVDYWPYLETETKDVCAEIPSTTRDMVRNLVNDEMNERIKKQSEQIEELTKQLDLYKQFINKVNADKIFREFVSQKGE